MYRKLLFSLFVFMTLVTVPKTFAEIDKFGQDNRYMELNGAIPKEYGRLVQVRDKWMFFEANDGTIRIVEFQIYDDTNHYISKLQNNVITRK